MSSNASNTLVAFMDGVEENGFQNDVIQASVVQSPSMSVKNADYIDQRSYSGPSSHETFPATQAVLDALAALSPRKNAVNVDLPPISFSQFENYTMDEQSTPVVFSFKDGSLSPRSTNPNCQTLYQTDRDDVGALCTTCVEKP